MKKLLRFDEEDLRNIIMEQYDVRPEQIVLVHTEETHGYGLGEQIEPVFYIEVELNEGEEK